MNDNRRASSQMREPNTQSIEWCGIPVVSDDATTELIHVSAPDEDPEQKLVFRVTRSTMELVVADFERYRPTLELMAENWREKKEELLRENPNNHKQIPAA